MTGKRPSFTVAQANALLPTLAPLLERLRAAHALMEELHDEVMTSVPTNGGGAAHRTFLEASELIARAMETIGEQGILVRDPSTGLVDFPAERNGVEIFLCWRLGEDEVAWWHPTDTGFAGRQPL